MTVQNFSYHSHTNFSDGNNTLEEMVAQAKKLGFCELGISDHLCVHKNIRQSKSWPLWEQRGNSHIFKRDFKEILPDFQKHCEHIRKVSAQSGLKLYVGFEVDFFTYSGWFAELQDFLKQLDYDYIITGNHMLFDEKCESLIDLYDMPVSSFTSKIILSGSSSLPLESAKFSESSLCTQSSEPRIGLIPSSEAYFEKHLPPNKLPRSVIAQQGIPKSCILCTNFGTSMAPNDKE